MKGGCQASFERWDGPRDVRREAGATRDSKRWWDLLIQILAASKCRGQGESVSLNEEVVVEEGMFDLEGVADIHNSEVSGMSMEVSG